MRSVLSLDQASMRHMRGITLIELLTVIIVVAVLASIAVASYRSYLLRANRTEARLSLLRIQAAQEKYFLQNNRYATNDELDDDPPDGLGIPTTSPGQFYTFTIDGYTSNSYRAVATAINGQTKDAAACRTLSIDQNGNRQPAANPECWR